MSFYILTILILALAMDAEPPRNSAESSSSVILFDFKTADEASWQVINDGVMGGSSQGYVAIDEGSLLFTGTLVTRGGGFTSVRADRGFDLKEYQGLELRVRGSGRTFEVEVGDGTRLRGRTVSRRAPFRTDGEWTLVQVPFSALKATVFGQPISAPPIDLSSVKRIGLYIVDGIDGPFRLEIDEIRAYQTSTD